MIGYIFRKTTGLKRESGCQYGLLIYSIIISIRCALLNLKEYEDFEN